jgi:branched-chain amino acid transport system substrate-binding protein
MSKLSRGLAWLALAGLSMAFPATAQIKIAYIDPLSGGAASAGINAQKHMTYLIDRANAAGGFNGEKLELLSFDNKVDPQESLIALKKALDDGARYVFQGNGSGVALAITDAVLNTTSAIPARKCCTSTTPRSILR